MNKQVFLLAKRKPGDPEERVIPVIVSMMEHDISEVNPIAAGGAYVKTKPGGQSRNVNYEVFESPLNVEGARIHTIYDGTALSPDNPYAGSEVDLGVTALNSAQGAGYAVTAYLTEVTSATDVTGEALDLPAATVGDTLVVINATAVALEVFPATSETINGAAANAVYDQPAKSRVHYYCKVAGAWEIVVA